MDFSGQITSSKDWQNGFIRKEVLEKIEMEGLEAAIENPTNKPL